MWLHTPYGSHWLHTLITLLKKKNCQGRLAPLKRKKMYPHYLFYYDLPQSQQDDQGCWNAPTPSLRLHARCREQVNAKGQQAFLAGASFRRIQTANSSFHRFSSIVFLPRSTPPLPVGTPICICEDPQGKRIRCQGQIQKWDTNSFHSRLWL